MSDELIRKHKSGTEVMVEWSDLGEGWDGDYNPEDPDDTSLLRFDVSVKRDGEWEAVDSASYCTQVPVATPEDVKAKGLEMIMDEVIDALAEDNSIRKACERMSWICPDSINRGVWEMKFSS
jgi:hypothetical protein